MKTVKADSLTKESKYLKKGEVYAFSPFIRRVPCHVVLAQVTFGSRTWAFSWSIEFFHKSCRIR